MNQSMGLEHSTCGRDVEGWSCSQLFAIYVKVCFYRREAVSSGGGAHRINGSSIGLVSRFKLMFAYPHVPGYNQI